MGCRYKAFIRLLTVIHTQQLLLKTKETTVENKQVYVEYEKRISLFFFPIGILATWSSSVKQTAKVK